MKTSLLVTTALEETWKKEENILFLGEWCKKPHREIIWNKFDFETNAFFISSEMSIKNKN